MSTFTFDDLLLWSERFPDWQRDALRRVLTGTLTAADIAELSDTAKVAQGLSKPGRPSPRPATTSHIRSSGASPPPVALLAVRDITYVNALASGPITFAPDGLTIIYGDNASGKSGIARILKKAGRARNPGGPIRPSVFEPDPGKPATATIEFRTGTAGRAFSWVDGSVTDNELTRINVFDASCAAVQIEENNRLTYTPEILQVFQDLAEACHAVGARLKAEHDALNNARPPEIERLTLRPHTAAGILVANLSMETNLADIDALCNVTDADRERFNTLKNALQDNPTLQAELLELRARRLKDLDDLTANLQSLLSDTALRDFETRLSDAAAAAEAAKAASQAFAANSALVGIGTAAWKQLWESARRYSQTLAYPSEPFPVTREDALCVLCQQPIAETAAQRLRSFEQFVQADVQQRAEKASIEVQKHKAQLEPLRIPLSGTQLRETALRDTPAAHSVKAFIVAAKLRRRYLLHKANGHTASRPGGLPPRSDQTAARASLAGEVKRLRAAAQDDERRTMQNELAELDDRLKLALLKDILHREVKRLLFMAILLRTRNDCDTTWITRKAGEVAQLVVTARLRRAFASNLSQLGFAAPPVEVRLGLGTIGQHPYRLSLIATEDVFAFGSPQRG